jgi:hypothetical protein
MDDSPVVIDGMYVAFCDILGFSELTISRFEATLSLYQAFGKLVSESAQEDVELAIYSDAVLLTSTSLASIVAIVRNVWFFALQHNMMIRGAIAQGKYWEHRLGKNLLIMSDALVRAVRLEKLVGVPAVVVADDIIVPDGMWAARFQSGPIATPLLHFRDRTIVNPFNLFWFRSAYGRAATLMEQYPRHRDKYLWFLELHETVQAEAELVPPDVLARFLDLGILKRNAPPE